MLKNSDSPSRRRQLPSDSRPLTHWQSFVRLIKVNRFDYANGSRIDVWGSKHFGALRTYLNWFWSGIGGVWCWSCSTSYSIWQGASFEDPFGGACIFFLLLHVGTIQFGCGISEVGDGRSGIAKPTLGGHLVQTCQLVFPPFNWHNLSNKTSEPQTTHNIHTAHNIENNSFRIHRRCGSKATVSKHLELLCSRLISECCWLCFFFFIFIFLCSFVSCVTNQAYAENVLSVYRSVSL